MNRLVSSLVVLVCALAAFLAWRNFRAGRGDIRGAGRLAAFAFGVEMLEWLCTAHHGSTFGELGLFFLGIMWAGFVAAFLWMLYVALEPNVRRHWPQSIISWSRLLSGGVRDPLVGGHVLFGVVFGVVVASFDSVERLVLAQYGSLGVSNDTLNSVLDARRMMGVLLSLLGPRPAVAMGFFLLLFLLRALLRRQWLAVAAFILLQAGPSLASDHPAVYTGYFAILGGLAIFILIQFGVLAFVIGPLVRFTLQIFPLTTDFSAWYAGSTIFALAVVLALAAYAFHTALAGRPVFSAGFLERE